MHNDCYVLTFVALEGGGVIHFIVFVVFVIGETLAVGTYASRHVLIGLRVILICVILILIWVILILLAAALLRNVLHDIADLGRERAGRVPWKGTGARSRPLLAEVIQRL